jgi:hypothetical protein
MSKNTIIVLLNHRLKLLDINKKKIEIVETIVAIVYALIYEMYHLAMTEDQELIVTKIKE